MRLATSGGGLVRLGLAGVLGVGAALLVACGSSSSALIPAGNAGPLQTDFNAIASDVKAGDCADARSAVAQARDDLAALPVSVNPQLLDTLTSGVATLASRASTECQLNAATDTSTSGESTTTQTETGTTNTDTETGTTQTDTGTDTAPTDTGTDTDTGTTPAGTDTGTTPTDTDTSPATTPGAGGAQAPGPQTVPFDPSGGTPGGTPAGGN